MSNKLLQAIIDYQTWGTLFEEMDLDTLARREGYTLDSGEYWFTLTSEEESRAYRFASNALRLRGNEMAWGYR